MVPPGGQVSTSVKTLRMGMIGIGVGGAEIMPAIDAMETIEMVAGADVVPTTLDRFKERYPQARGPISLRANSAKIPTLMPSGWRIPDRFHSEHAHSCRRCG